MTQSITIEGQLHFRSGRTGRRHVHQGPAPAKPEPGPQAPRVARLMALAIRFEKLVRDGEVADYADLVRLGHVTRARVTQIMNLLNLAPDIQEAILFMPPNKAGEPQVTERHVRPIAAISDWREQRTMWCQIRSKRS